MGTDVRTIFNDDKTYLAYILDCSKGGIINKYSYKAYDFQLNFNGRLLPEDPKKWIQDKINRNKYVAKFNDGYEVVAIYNNNQVFSLTLKKSEEGTIIPLITGINGGGQTFSQNDQGIVNCKLYITKENLIKLGWSKNEKFLNDNIVTELNKMLNKYNITSKEQICHFISQVMKESNNWKLAGLGDGVIEMGQESYFSKYEPNTLIGEKIGNTKRGDGPLFRGAGYIHLTGRANYTAFYNYLLKKGINDPLILTKGYLQVAERYAWETACWFWSINTTLNKISLVRGSIVTKTVTDNREKVTVTGNNTVFEVTRTVNGGYNGIVDRMNYYNLVKKILNY